MEHRERKKWCEEISNINKKMSEEQTSTMDSYNQNTKNLHHIN